LVLFLDDEKVQFNFQTEEDFNPWVVTCDSDWGEGYSTASLKPSPSGELITLVHYNILNAADNYTKGLPELLRGKKCFNIENIKY